jgi:hypothetical protein
MLRPLKADSLAPLLTRITPGVRVAWRACHVTPRRAEVRQKRVPIDGEMVIVRPAKEVLRRRRRRAQQPPGACRTITPENRRLAIGDAALSGHRSWNDH